MERGRVACVRSGRELARDPAWKLNAQPESLGCGVGLRRESADALAIARAARPGHAFRHRFRRADRWWTPSRSIAPPISGTMRLELEGPANRRRGGSEIPPAPDLRAAAVREIARRGITHILLRDGDFGAADFRDRTAEWGLRLAGEMEGWRLYAVK